MEQRKESREKASLVAMLRGKHEERDSLDLRGADLSGADLSEVDLSGLDLAGANLTEADLSHSVLRQTLLGGANLYAARLHAAEFLLADLSNARLDNCTGDQAGFGGANLESASLRGATLNGSTFSRANMSKADLSVASLAGARLRESNLEDAVFASAKMVGAELNGAALSRASFREADLRQASFAGITGYQRADWIGVDLRDADFRRSLNARRLILDENYLDEFRHATKGNEWLYQIWKFTSDCGRSLSRWALCTFGLVFLFAVAFLFVDMDFGRHTPNFLSSFYFSIVTLTTLGYGDILPASAFAQILVIAEVALGYMTLGGLISIFANKMARRAE